MSLSNASADLPAIDAGGVTVHSAAKTLTAIWPGGAATGCGAHAEPFYVGDGGTFTAPASTTKLLLGLADGYAFAGTPSYYGDNTGSLSVSVGIAEPVSLALLAPWLAGLAVLRRRPA
jgi:hypothetical protein